MIVVEVINHLPMFYVAKVNITSLGGPLDIVELGVDIFIFEPTFLGECFSQFMISSLDDVHFLIVTTSVSFFPGCHVNIILSIILILFLLTTVYIDIISVFYFGFFW